MSHQSGACDNRALEFEAILHLHWKPSRDRSSIARIIYPHPTCKRQNAPYAKVAGKHLPSLTGQFLLPACDLLRYNPVQFSGARPLRLYAPSLNVSFVALSLALTVATARLVHKVAPVYPSSARAYHMEGTVVLQATISKKGRIRALNILPGPREFVESALGAVQRWRYRPYVVNGEPVEVMTEIDVN
jgi:TonB family protein